MRKQISIFMVMLVSLLLCFSVNVNASEVVLKCSEVNNKKQLTLSSDKLFDIPIMNPGDRFNNRIIIENNTKDKIRVRLTDIINLEEDTYLADALLVKVVINGKVVYEGPYSNLKTTDWFELKPGEKIFLDVYLYFPGECDNSYQNRSFKSRWIFEVDDLNANHNDTNQTGQTINNRLILGITICAGFIIYFKSKRKNEEEKNKNKEQIETTTNDNDKEKDNEDKTEDINM